MAFIVQHHKPSEFGGHVFCLPILLVPICDVCGQTVSLEDCKTDERGDAVHEECYLRRLDTQKAPPVTKTYGFSAKAYLEST
jgi:hypothetical protein